MDKDFKDFVCTHSIRVEIDNRFACVVGLDLSTKWIRDMMERIKADGFRILPIMAEHLVPLRTIPPIHNDPFDRIMVCQSIVEKIPLISYDRNVNAYFT